LARAETWKGDPDLVRLGTLVGQDPRGRPLVVVDEGAAPVVARVCTTEAPPTEQSGDPVPVLLWLEQGDPLRPILVGFVRETLAAPARAGGSAIVNDRTLPIELNGKALIFEGQEEIVLRCGQGSLTIRANGQIVVKGTRLISRASESNKIRGASVEIN
jgi:hypothetical protein